MTGAIVIVILLAAIGLIIWVEHDTPPGPGRHPSYYLATLLGFGTSRRMKPRSWETEWTCPNLQQRGQAHIPRLIMPGSVEPDERCYCGHRFVRVEHQGSDQ